MIFVLAGVLFGIGALFVAFDVRLRTGRKMTEKTTWPSSNFPLNAEEDHPDVADTGDPDAVTQDAVLDDDEPLDPTHAMNSTQRWFRGRQPNGSALRKARRAWADAVHASYQKADGVLAQTWEGLPIATGETARDVVSGQVNGMEFHLLSLGDAALMAVRRSLASEVMLEARRITSEVEAPSELGLVGESKGFQLWSNNPQAVQRACDVRMKEAMKRLPASVQRVWFTSDWVLGQLARSADSRCWDALLPILVTLAEASMVFPPRRGATSFHDATALDPSRPMVVAQPPVADAFSSVQVVPTLPRNAERQPLPKRGVGAVFGTVDDREMGTDTVEPIAIGEQPDPHAFHGTRVLRPQQASTIFDDLARELGEDPLAGTERDADREKETPRSSGRTGLHSCVDEDPAEQDS